MVVTSYCNIPTEREREREREREIYLGVYVCRDWYTNGLQQTLDSFHALDYGKESKVFFEPTSEHPCRATN